MPQFDTFSFFSQLFWVFLTFSYLYLVLCFYILPAFAAVLKIRAKKLAQTNISSNSSVLINQSNSNFLFFENLSAKLGKIFFYRKNLTNDINSVYSYLTFKNETFSQINSLLLAQFKAITLFA